MEYFEYDNPLINKWATLEQLQTPDPKLKAGFPNFGEWSSKKNVRLQNI